MAPGSLRAPDLWLSGLSLSAVRRVIRLRGLLFLGPARDDSRSTVGRDSTVLRVVDAQLRRRVSPPLAQAGPGNNRRPRSPATTRELSRDTRRPHPAFAPATPARPGNSRLRRLHGLARWLETIP